MTSSAGCASTSLALLRERTEYDPWRDAQQNWPDVRIVIEPMSGDLLGEVRDNGAVIALRAGTSQAQRRCTLTHELVHLERGILDCGPWWPREELQVHCAASVRLITLPALADAIRELGGDHDHAALAQRLDVDRETLALRLSRLGEAELRGIHRRLADPSASWMLA